MEGIIRNSAGKEKQEKKLKAFKELLKSAKYYRGKISIRTIQEIKADMLKNDES